MKMLSALCEILMDKNMFDTSDWGSCQITVRSL